MGPALNLLHRNANNVPWFFVLFRGPRQPGMVVNRLILFILFVLAFPARTETYRFKHYSIEQGLSASMITCIAQDRLGYLWFGTYDGLNRFDGYEFKVYRHRREQPNSLSSNVTLRLYQDRQNRLWVGGATGVDLYDDMTDGFRHFPDATGLPMYVSDFSETPEGQLVVFVYNRIYMVDPEQGICQSLNFGSGATGVDTLYGISAGCVDQDGNFWIGYGKFGLIRWNRQTGATHHFRVAQDRQAGFISDCINDIYLDQNKTIWIASRDGLMRYDASTQRFLTLLPNPSYPRALTNASCNHLTMDQDQNMVISAWSNGLVILNPGASETKHWLHDPTNSQSLQNNSVQCVFVDRRNDIWVGTLRGLDYIQRGKSGFITYRTQSASPALPCGVAASFCELPNADLLIGTDGDGIYYLNRKTGELNRPLQPLCLQTYSRNQSILTLYRDSDQNLWFGGFLIGLLRLEPKQNRLSTVLFSQNAVIPIKNDDVRHILEDRRGDLWIATNGDGVFCFTQRDPRRYHQYRLNANQPSLGPPSDYCLLIFEDRENQLWIGTYSGLCRLDRTTGLFTHYSANADDPHGLSNGWIYAMHQDRQGRLWIGTAQGLNLYDRQHNAFSVFGLADGLPGDIINAIVEDVNANLWISTNNGLARFNPDSRQIRTFTVHDGLQGNEFFHGAYAALSTGELVFGGANGFTVFRPDSLSENIRFPSVVITSLDPLEDRHTGLHRASGPGRYLGTEEIRLNYAQARRVTISFTALEYDYPEKIYYRYRLQNYHDDWINAGQNRMATFLNVHPGRFVFSVSASNSSGIWGSDSRTLVIHVAPPWWRTWYAYLFYFLVVTLALVAYHLYSMNLVRLRTDLQTQKLEKEKALELESCKSEFFTNISHEFRTPLTLILVPLQNLLRVGRKLEWPRVARDLETMRNSAERLVRLVNQVIDFNRIEAGRLQLEKKEIDLTGFMKTIIETFHPLALDKQITLTFESEQPACPALVDPDKLDAVVFNLLSNAFKFTPRTGAINVMLRQLADDRVEISVRDTGPGIPETDLPHIFDRFYQVRGKTGKTGQGAGIGLSLSKELVALHAGELTVKNLETGGACFFIRLPRGIGEHLSELAGPAAVSSPLVHQEEHPSLLTSSPLEKITLLLVEDDHELRLFLTAELESVFHILTANDGQQALEMARLHIPDLVISDIMMAGMDGLKLTQILKNDELTSHIPIILLTSRTSEEQQLQGLATGADDYITKPFNLDLLKIRIRNLLDSRHVMRRRFGREIRLAPKDIVITPVDEQFLQRAMSTVEEHLADSEFDVEAFSVKMGLSRAQLFRKLKALTSETPIEFIQTMRLRRAAQLLEKSQRTITEICFEVGFNYPSHFTKLFQSKFGMVPKEYRKKNQPNSA
jgi:signal transduction histidine kinase/ligand-binding sensor domain-containing protein/DNA-binding response OmpR family regulator